MDQSNAEQDLTTKYRMTGAVVWLLLLIVVVPSWYNDPVNFSPDQEISAAAQEEQKVVVDKPFLLPGSAQPGHVESTTTSAKTISETQGDQSAPTEKTRQVQSVDQAAVKQVASADKTEPSTEKGTQWIIRVAAYRSKEKADFLTQRLKYDYEVFVKYFPKSKYYSVRVGPYQDKREALKDQQNLNRVLHIRSEVAKLK